MDAQKVGKKKKQDVTKGDSKEIETVIQRRPKEKGERLGR